MDTAQRVAAEGVAPRVVRLRPTLDPYFLTIAKIVSTRSTCSRRQVGCVLVDDRKHILATGYNGVAAGQPHCTDAPCEGASFPSGQGLDSCQATHAEVNALVQCRDVYSIRTAYCTTAPCVNCLKMLLSTSCKEIVFIEDYPHSLSKSMWESAGRIWRKYDGILLKELI